MWQVSVAFLAAVYAAMTRGPGASPTGPLYQAWLGLYIPPTPQPTNQTTMAGITEATYDGYSRQLITWFPAWLSSGGTEVMDAQDLWFSPTDGLTPNLITGVFIASAFYGGTLWMSAPTPAPGIQLYGPASAMKVQPGLSMGFSTIYGSPIIQS